MLRKLFNLFNFLYTYI